MRTSFKVAHERKEACKAEKVKAQAEKAAPGMDSNIDSAAGMDLNTAPRLVNGKIVPRHLIVFKIEDKVIHMTVEMTVSMRAIYAKIEQYLGFDVTLHQTDKKETYLLDHNDISEHGMNFGYHVDIKRVVPLNLERTKDGCWTKHEIPGVLRANAPALSVVALKASVEAAGAGAAVKAVEKAPKEPAAGYHIKQHPPPAGVRRGGPGAWMLAQAPRKYDQDGKPIGAVEYSEVYVAL